MGDVSPGRGHGLKHRSARAKPTKVVEFCMAAIVDSEAGETEARRPDLIADDERGQPARDTLAAWTSSPIQVFSLRHVGTPMIAVPAEAQSSTAKLFRNISLFVARGQKKEPKFRGFFATRCAGDAECLL